MPNTDSADRFYRYPVGAEWAYQANFDGVMQMATYKVTELKGERRIVEYEIKNQTWFDEAWYVDDGYVVFASAAGETTPMWRIYKIGSQRGDRWETLPGIGEAVHLGTTEVTVPAGTYSDVIHISLTDEDKKSHDFYFAPNIGLIKWTTTGSDSEVCLELLNFDRQGLD